MKLNTVKETDFLTTIRKGQKVKRVSSSSYFYKEMQCISKFSPRDMLLYPSFAEKGETVPQ